MPTRERTERDHKRDALLVLDALTLLSDDNPDRRRQGLHIIHDMSPAIATSTSLAMLSWVIHTWAGATGRTDEDLVALLRQHWELT